MDSLTVRENVDLGVTSTTSGERSAGEIPLLKFLLKPILLQGVRAVGVLRLLLIFVMKII